jgi:hypothetical protein
MPFLVCSPRHAVAAGRNLRQLANGEVYLQGSLKPHSNASARSRHAREVVRRIFRSQAGLAMRILQSACSIVHPSAAACRFP